MKPRGYYWRTRSAIDGRPVVVVATVGKVKNPKIHGTRELCSRCGKGRSPVQTWILADDGHLTLAGASFGDHSRGPDLLVNRRNRSGEPEPTWEPLESHRAH